MRRERLPYLSRMQLKKKEEPKDEKVDQKFEDLLSKFLKESNTKLDEARARYNQKTKKKNSRN